MVNTNKILTVSYGTFSCTLEGFDDSFGTMKAIAEYFRDLASDDRYFGAEPPTPDAEMLARIAEREITRRVEAQIEDNKIHLRAEPSNTLPVAAAAAAASAEAVAATANDTAEPLAEAETPHAEETTAADESLTQAPIETAEIETPEAEAPEAPAETAQEPIETPVIDLPVEVEAETASEASEAPAPIAQEAEAAPVTQEAEAPEEETEEETLVEAQAETEETLEPAAQSAIDPDSVAAKLQRIRAVVEQAEESGEDGFFTEDEHAEEFLADANEDIEAALEIDDEAEAARAEQPDDEAGEDHDDIAALLQRYGSAGDAADDDDTIEEDEPESVFGSVEQPEEQAPEPEADIIAMTEETAEQADLTEPSADDNESTTSAEPPVRARIIKMKRADFEAAIADGDLVEANDDEQETDPDALSQDDENDLLRELAAVEAELNASDARADDALADDDDAIAFDDTDEDDDIFAEIDDDRDAANDTKDDSKPTGTSLFAPDGNEDEMSRIFAEANTQLDEEGGKGRRNAIAHLRAAVEATRAEAGAGGTLTDNPDTEAYRDDLDSVVRPRRPEAAKPNTRRPEAPRAAPLKLVAEQRVDLDDTHSTPIRPRRVSAAPVADVAINQPDAGDFAEYAESVGANALPELLEAAASYLSFVEGREQFSRPQLMTQVRQAEKDDFSREDGLRSFGQLLREGKIEKLEGGRFKASASISYRPDQRYAGE
ncbi:hypothetical protein U5922_012280 [Aquicoccus sp. G2-2]|uniref:hypothetical protein n=1 Tax=Aquicoccus sp. G2-2 TaxID=3092120 RepID=UPI002AE0377F|nr:hypothetical protein [Aquicoccus sp. G2-2]MEA1114195.1 hypothetical protein [Aquicoccus sp. G2-2]